MGNLEKTHINIGFMPLLDSAPIIWAWHRGFFRQFGLEVTLAKEVSWASLRDRLAYGALDAAQCLAPMILAANLGADQVGVPFVSALTLSENWAAISLSTSLASQLSLRYPQNSARENALALAQHIQRKADPSKPLKLAHVFQFSLHHYL
ncbi:MAG: nitrate transporter, partial [Moraxellaceae bacterium]